MSQAQLNAWRQIQRIKFKKIRDFHINLPVRNVQVDTDSSREDIKGAIEAFDLLAVDGKVEWTMADNSVDYLTLDQLKAIREEYIVRKGRAFRNFNAAVQATLDTDDPEQVLAIDFSPGA